MPILKNVRTGARIAGCWFCVVLSVGYGEFKMGTANQGTTLGSQVFSAKENPGAAPAYMEKTKRAGDPLMLTGTCAIESELQVPIPCRTGKVSLLDEAKKFLRSTDIDESGFTFRVDKDRSYYLSVQSPPYETSKPILGPFRSSDSVLVQLRKPTKQK